MTATKSKNAPFLAPPPTVVIVKSSEWNAHAMRLPSRFKFQVKHTPASASQSEKLENEQAWKQGEFADVSVNIGEGAGRNSLQHSLNAAGTIPGNIEDLDQILKRQSGFLKRSKAQCAWKSWTLIGGNVNSECGEWVQGTWLDSHQVMPFIFVHAGLLADSPFDIVITVLAHELGRYLFAHGIIGAFGSKGRPSSANEPWSESDGYLYREDEYVRSGVPKPLHGKEVTREARQAIFDALHNEVPEPFGNAQFSSAVLVALTGTQTLVSAQFEKEQDYKKLLKVGKRAVKFNELVEFQCRRVAAPHLCDKYAASVVALEDPKNSKRRSEFYSGFSNSLLSFADKIHIRYSDTKKGMRGICKESLDSAPRLCADHFFSWMHSRYPGARLISEKIAAKLKGGKQATLTGWISAVKPEADSLWSSTVQGGEFLKSHRLGWYNNEQQADDFSVELMSHLGIDPRAGMTLWAEFAAMLTEKSQFPEMNLQNGYPVALSCIELAKTGFRNGAGDWLPVRLAKDWNDPHHSYCYRAFNIAREIDFHRYVTNPSRLPPAFKEVAANWPEIGIAAGEMIQNLFSCQAGPSYNEGLQNFMAR